MELDLEKKLSKVRAAADSSCWESTPDPSAADASVYLEGETGAAAVSPKTSPLGTPRISTVPRGGPADLEGALSKQRATGEETWESAPVPSAADASVYLDARASLQVGETLEWESLPAASSADAMAVQPPASPAARAAPPEAAAGGEGEAPLGRLAACGLAPQAGCEPQTFNLGGDDSDEGTISPSPEQDGEDAWWGGAAATGPGPSTPTREQVEAARKAQEDAEEEMAMVKALSENTDSERLAREEAERQAQEEAAKKAQEEAERVAREEAERQAQEEAARKAQEEAERLAREEAERQAQEEAAKKAQEEAERLAREEAERQAQEEEEAARKAQEEAERLAREEAERQAQEEAAKKAQEEAERLAREEAERQAQEAARKAQEEAERLAREEAERQAQEEAARKAQEEAERLAREEAERQPQTFSMGGDDSDQGEPSHEQDDEDTWWGGATAAKTPPRSPAAPVQKATPERREFDLSDPVCSSKASPILRDAQDDWWAESPPKASGPATASQLLEAKAQAEAEAVRLRRERAAAELAEFNRGHLEQLERRRADVRAAAAAAPGGGGGGQPATTGDVWADVRRLVDTSAEAAGASKETGRKSRERMREVLFSLSR